MYCQNMIKTTEGKFQQQNNNNNNNNNNNDNNNAKLYVPVITLSITDNIKFLENIKERFKITISWSRYRSKITT